MTENSLSAGWIIVAVIGFVILAFLIFARGDRNEEQEPGINIDANIPLEEGGSNSNGGNTGGSSY